MRLTIRLGKTFEMISKAKSVEEYLTQLPADRRADVEKVREVVLKNLGEGFEEGIQYGMIGYYVPHSIHPQGYHCDPKQPLPFAGLASQKNHISLYIMCLYGDMTELERFKAEWAKSGKKLDMGKSCIRFKKVADVDLPAIAGVFKRTTVAKYLRGIEIALAASKKEPRPAAKKIAKKAAKKVVKKATKKVGKKAVKKGSKKTSAKKGS